MIQNKHHCCQNFSLFIAGEQRLVGNGHKFSNKVNKKSKILAERLN